MCHVLACTIDCHCSCTHNFPTYSCICTLGKYRQSSFCIHPHLQYIKHWYKLKNMSALMKTTNWLSMKRQNNNHKMQLESLTEMVLYWRNGIQSFDTISPIYSLYICSMNRDNGSRNLDEWVYGEVQLSLCNDIVWCIPYLHNYFQLFPWIPVGTDNLLDCHPENHLKNHLF